MPSESTKPSIERRRFDRFMHDFKNKKFGTQRLGQAFYNEFNLARLVDQSRVGKFWHLDGEHAIRSIKDFYNFN